MTRFKPVWPLMACAVILCVFSACATPSRESKDPLTPTEQLLFSSAIKKGLKDFDAGIPKGATITLTASDLRVDQSLNGDVIHQHLKHVIAGWLGQQGVIILEGEKEATYRVHIIVESIGTTQRTRLLGIPATNSLFLPIAVPDLALYKRTRTQGYVRFYFNIFEKESGRFLRSTDPQVGSVTETVYTAFFFITWRETDMDSPPPIFN